MVNRPDVLAVIPARGGSKTLPRKNIKLLSGAPLIAYSIAAGLQATTVTRVIVSTDDEEIASIALKWGAEVPYMRPAELAEDLTPDLPVFEHVLEWLRVHENYVPQIVVQLRPTTPIRPPGCVDTAVNILLENAEADSVRGIVLSGQNPYKMWKLHPDGYMKPLLDEGFTEPYNMPRQKLPVTYWQTGHVDAIRTSTITEQHSLTGNRIYPLVLDSRYTIDIDSQQDWEQAESMIRRLEIPFIHVPASSGLEATRLLILDFDGVLTDNRVWVDEDGREMIAANRSDGMGISMIRQLGIEVIVLSREANKVVAARCRKLGIECQQGVLQKGEALKALVAERKLEWSQVVYLGNDTNDLDCMRLVGCAVAVADAHPAVLPEANLVLKANGGHGAVRELCDLIQEHIQRKGHHA